MTTSSVVWRWLPRLLALLYAAFLSLFAFDSWEGVGFWQGLAAFLVHLLPVYFVLLALVIGWRRPQAGGVLFLALAVVFAVFFGWREAAVLALMGGPLVVIGVLFLLVGRPSPRARLGV